MHALSNRRQLAFTTKNIKLGDIYEDDVVGERPIGVPCNVRITECPDVLFDVAKSEEHCVVIGGFPWHYIIAYMPNNGDMSVFDMKNNKEAINGRLNLVQDPTYTGEKAWFHWDESGRIIHTGPNKMRMLKMKQSSTNSEVVELFNINMINNATQRSPGPTFTSSGRVVTPRVFDSSLVAWPGLETLKGVEHENELDLLIVVITDEDHKGHVCYHDNDTGEMYKVVTLEGRWEEHLDYDITVDLDTIWCIVKNRGVFESLHLFYTGQSIVRLVQPILQPVVCVPSDCVQKKLKPNTTLQPSLAANRNKIDYIKIKRCALNKKKNN
ncbi:DDB1- and CUL4-associated factor 17-like [Antedon mediterranea]|uniref:DDB1- and CUL4-associated factor 17-like n=1 Tax=Antedon mediterranea TaxID=105859 RepID=UPI003AF7B658